MRLRSALTVLCLLAGLALATGPLEAAKQNKNFVLYNQTGGAIDAFHFSPSDSDDWGDNQLTNGPLYDGEWIWNKHNYRARFYDLQIELENGYVFELHEVDLSEVLRIYLKCNGKECWGEFAYE